MRGDGDFDFRLKRLEGKLEECVIFRLEFKRRIRFIWRVCGWRRGFFGGGEFGYKFVL